MPETSNVVDIQEPNRFSNILIKVHATDIAMYGESKCIVTILEKYGIPLATISENALIFCELLDEQRGLMGYKIVWRKDGKPFKKKFIEQNLKPNGYVPHRFLDFIATGQTN